MSYILSYKWDESCNEYLEESRPPDKEKDKLPPPSQNPANPQKSKPPVLIDSMNKKIFLQVLWSISI